MNASSQASIYNAGLITILVRDLDEAVKFYTGTVGLELKSRYGNEFALVQGPGISIGLHPAKDGNQEPGRTSIGLSVDSLEAAMESLSQRGLQFTRGITEDPPMRFAFFTDPNGVELYLAQETEWR